jgi:hypothetical protein
MLNSTRRTSGHCLGTFKTGGKKFPWLPLKCRFSHYPCFPPISSSLSYQCFKGLKSHAPYLACPYDVTSPMATHPNARSMSSSGWPAQCGCRTVRDRSSRHQARQSSDNALHVIREVLGQYINYTDWGFSWDFSITRGKSRNNTLSGLRPLPSQYLPVHGSSFINHPTLLSIGIEMSVGKVNWGKAVLLTICLPREREREGDCAYRQYIVSIGLDTDFF